MQEEFEKKIRERMHTFGIQPAHQVWDEVDAVLNRQKHRRFFVGWWILLGLVVLGGGILLFDKDGIHNDKLNQQPIITSDTASNNKFADKPKNVDTRGNVSTKNNNSNNQEAQKTFTTQSNNNSSNAITGEPAKTLGGIQPAAALKDKGLFAFNSHTPQIGNNPTSVTNNTGDVATVSPQSGAKNSADDIIKDSDGYNNNQKPLALLNKDGDNVTTPPKLQQDTAKTFAQPDKTANKNTPPQVNTKTIATQKSKWFLTFSAGTTQTTSKGLFNAADAASASPAAYYANVPAITALSAYKYNLALPGIGFHISAGGLYERQVSAHWNVFGGIAVAYLSNTQQTGTQYKSALNAVTGNTGFNLSQPQLSLLSYYQSGSTGTVVNKAWQANIPLGVGYVFNSKSKTKFMLNGGLSLAWLFNSSWLIPDARYDKLYYSKTVFNNTAVNWQIGPAIEFKNQWRFGLQYQQSFTTLAKSYVTPKLYWQNISIYTAIPLGRGKKHK